MKLRWQGRWVPWVWAVWLIVAAVLSWEPLQAYTPRLRGVTLASLVIGFAVAIPAYQWFRVKTALRWEPPLLAVFLLVIPLTREPLATLVTACMLAAAYGAGRAMRERLRLDAESHSAEIVLSLSIGLAGLSFCLFALGLSGLFTPFVFAFLLLLPIAAFHKQVLGLGAEIRGVYQSWVCDEEMRHPWVSISLGFGVVFVFCSLLVVLSPSNAYDPTALHLPLARLYAEEGEVPWSSFGYGLFPQGAEVVMGLLYAFVGQPAAQMVSPLFFILTALVGMALAREAGVRRSSAVMGLVAAAAIPFMHWSGTVSKNDTVMAFFLVGSFYCCLRGSREENPNWLRVSIVLLGGAFGVKHVALFGAIPIGLLYLRTLWRRRQIWREGVVLAGLFAVFGLGWHSRTFYLTGNPVYPTSPVAAVEALRPDSMRPPDHNRVPFYYIPWMIHFDGSQAFDIRARHPMGVFFVFFIPVWLLVRRENQHPLERTCLFFVGMYLLYWGLVWPVVRYAIAPFLIVTMLSVERLRAFHDESRIGVRGSVTLALSCSLLFSLLIVTALEVNVDQIRLWAGKIDREEYLIRNFLPYPSLHYLREHAGPEDEILSINNDTAAYAPVLSRFHSHMLRPEDGQERIFVLLRERPYDYVIVRKLQWTDGVASKLEELGAKRVHNDPFFFVVELPEGPLAD